MVSEAGQRDSASIFRVRALRPAAALQESRIRQGLKNNTDDRRCALHLLSPLCIVGNRERPLYEDGGNAGTVEVKVVKRPLKSNQGGKSNEIAIG